MNDKAMALVRQNGAELAVPEWESKLDLIRRTVARGATDDQLALFLHQARRTGLDPLARQIHCVVRTARNGEKQMAIQTAIDGYRLLADRTGKYAGSDDYRFDEGLTEFEHIRAKRGSPTTATVTVWKLVSGQRVPFTATARWDEYYPGEQQGFMWKKMPYLMLGKCTEALALRKAFPAELSGIYTDDEMQQADRSEPAPVRAAPKRTYQEVFGDEDGEPVTHDQDAYEARQPTPDEVFDAEPNDSPADVGDEAADPEIRAAIDGLACEVCGTPLDDWHKPDGSVISAAQMAVSRRRRFGRVTCGGDNKCRNQSGIGLSGRR